MLETGYMNYFNVDSCGLYKMRSDVTYGCELGETFSLIQQWVKGRPLSMTIPWDPTQSRRNKPKCYCKDIYECPETGDYLVVLWKSDSSSAGTLWGAPTDNKTGSGEVVKYTNEYKGDKVIWGRPCYYWVIPSHNIIISIKFDHSVCDAQMLEDYVTACMTNRVDHPDRKIEHTEGGYARISYHGDEATRYSYRFATSLKSIDTSTSELRELAKKVTHIIRRESILVYAENARAEWLKIFSSTVPFLAPKPSSKQRRIEVRAEAKPTVEEIRQIIESNAKEGRKTTDWDRVGFETDSGITWVDSYRLRDIVVFGSGDKIFEAKSLYEKISGSRNNYLKPVAQVAQPVAIQKK